MATVFLALGSNVGDSQQYISKAIELLGEKVSNIKTAPLYRSPAMPVPGHDDMPDFLNTAIRGETNLEPLELLKFVKNIEKEIGRIYRFRWGPREIDIDIIFYDDLILDTPELTIPHSGANERDFVLKPISDIDATFIDPKTKHMVNDLFEKLPVSELTILHQSLE